MYTHSWHLRVVDWCLMFWHQRQKKKKIKVNFNLLGKQIRTCFLIKKILSPQCGQGLNRFWGACTWVFPLYGTSYRYTTIRKIRRYMYYIIIIHFYIKNTSAQIIPQIVIDWQHIYFKFVISVLFSNSFLVETCEGCIGNYKFDSILGANSEGWSHFIACRPLDRKSVV